MKIHLGIRDDIRHVAFRMWRRGKDELAKVGVYDPEEIAKKLIAMSGEYAFSFYHHGEPVAVFGAQADKEGNYVSWFAATEQFEEIGRKATITLKRFISEKTAERPGVKLKLISAITHPEADRWFRLLGFYMVEAEGFFREYEYRLPKKG